MVTTVRLPWNLVWLNHVCTDLQNGNYPSLQQPSDPLNQRHPVLYIGYTILFLGNCLHKPKESSVLG